MADDPFASLDTFIGNYKKGMEAYKAKRIMEREEARKTLKANTPPTKVQITWPSTVPSSTAPSSTVPSSALTSTPSSTLEATKLSMSTTTSLFGGMTRGFSKYMMKSCIKYFGVYQKCSSELEKPGLVEGKQSTLLQDFAFKCLEEICLLLSFSEVDETVEDPEDVRAKIFEYADKCGSVRAWIAIGKFFAFMAQTRGNYEIAQVIEGKFKEIANFAFELYKLNH
jgi:hypothetical protein